MKVTTCAVLSLVILFLVACSVEVKCEKPYMRMGNLCCLDVNGNAICDGDEQKESVVCNAPYIRMGTSCCLDENRNNICDTDEKKPAQVPASEEKSAELKGNYSLTDLQADINKVLSVYFGREDMIFRKHPLSTPLFDVYTDARKNSVLIGYPRAGKETFQVLEKFHVVLINIRKEDDFIRDKNTFMNFIRAQMTSLAYPTQLRRNTTLESIKQGELKQLVEKDSPSRAAKYNLTYVNMSVSRTPLIENLTLFDTVSDKMIEYVNLSLEKYDVNYRVPNSTSTLGYDVTTEFFSIDYVQFYATHCTSDIIIVIYTNGYREPYGYTGLLDAKSLKAHTNNIRKDMLPEAQALINMCEQRYKFDYLRWR